MKISTKKQLLAGTSALALATALAASPAFATDWLAGTTTALTAQELNAGATTLSIGAGGSLIVAGDAAVNTVTQNTTIVVNATAAGTTGIGSTGGANSAISIGTGGSVDSITLTQGKITSDSTALAHATILMDGTADTAHTTVNSVAYTGNVINVTASGSVTNTGNGAGATAINLGSASAASSSNVNSYNIINAGTISSSANAASNAIMVGDKAGQTVYILNTGTITSGASGNAIGLVANGTADANTVATVVTGVGSAITGAINLGTNTGSSLTLGGGTVAGAIDTAGTVTVNQASFATGGNIGTTTTLGHLNINDGDVLDASGGANNITATSIKLGSTTGTGTLKIGTGTVTGAIDGAATSSGTISFGANGTGTIAGNVGGVAGAGNGVAAINALDGATGLLNGDAKATTFTVGTVASGAGATGTLELKTGHTYTGSVVLEGTTSTLIQEGTAAITGTVTSAQATALGTGAGVYDITGTAGFTLGAGGAAAFTSNNAIGSTTNSFAHFNIGDAVTANIGHNVFATTTTIGTGTSGELNQTSGLITGNVVLGANAIYDLNGGSGFTGTLTGAAGTVLNVKQNYTSLAANTIGTGTAVATINVTDGKTLDVATNNAGLSAGAIVLGTTNGGANATLNIGTGTFAGTVDGKQAGQGIFNVKGNNTLTANVGTTKLATVNIYDGVNLTTGDNSVSATNINIGSGGTGGTLTTGTGTLTGAINSSSAGTGTLSVAANKTTTLASGTTVGSTSSLAAINVANGATLTLGTNAGGTDTVKASQITLTGSGNLNVEYSTITGKIDGAGGNTATVTFNQNNTLNGNIGSGTAVATVAVVAGKEVHADTNNNTIGATALSLDTGSILDLGTGAVTGNIDGAGANTGIVNFNGTQTTAGSIGKSGSNGIATVNVNSGAAVTLGTGGTNGIDATTINIGGASATSFGQLNLGATGRTNIGNIVMTGYGALNIGSTNTQVLTGTLSTAATNAIDVTITGAGAGAIGKLALGANAATLTAGTTLNVSIASGSGFIPTGTAWTYLTDTGGSVNQLTPTSDSAAFTFAETTHTATTRTITATRVGYGVATASNSNASAVGSVLEAIGVANGAPAANTQVAAFLGTLDSAPNATVLANDLKTATPQVNQSGATALTSTSQSLDVVGTRLSQLRAGIDESTAGMAAGGAVADKGLWIQGFGTAATQDQRSGVDGYNATTGGVAVGGDMAVADNSRLGLSFSYAKSSVDGNGTTVSSTDIDSYQLNAYGSHNMGAWYTDGLLGAAYHNYNGTRNVAGGLVANSGDYNGETYTARAGGGYHFMTNNGIDITPNGSFTYSYNHTEGYTETGAGGLDNIVSSSDTQALIGRIGVDLGHNYTYNTMLIRPVVRAAYLYDFIGDQQDTTSQFTAGGATFKVKDASPARSAFDLGASLNVARTDNISFSADYDFEAKSQYTSHSGVLRARYNF